MQLTRKFLVFPVLMLLNAGASPAVLLSRDQIISEADKVAQAQLKAMGDKTSIDWTWGVMQAGYADFSHVSPEGAACTQAMTQIADKKNWTLASRTKDPFHADDFCIAQAWLDLYAAHPDPARIAPIRQRVDALVDHLIATKDDPKLTFWWCDALFMAPSVLARVSAITGDRKYLDAMDGEFWRTTNAFYDRRENLFYRDARFPGKLDSNGKKIFWSRGNGWVLGGIARTLEFMPADYPSRGKYETLFKDMSAKLITLQQSDGTWPASLLDTAIAPGPETSGTSLFTFGMAWGINHGLLDRSVYGPVVVRGWSAMLSHRRADGLPGYVQAVGDQPVPAKPDGTQVYATGGYLMAATQLQKLAPLEQVVVSPAAPTTDVSGPDASRCFARYVPERMDDIAWENDSIAYRIYGPALQQNPREHSGSGIDVWVKSVRYPGIDQWYKSNKYHVDHGTGLDFYEVGLSRGDGGLGVWDNGQLFNSKDWADYKMLDLGPDQCGFTLSYDPWDANGRKVWEHPKMTLKAGSNLTRIQSTIDSDRPGEIIIGIGLAKRDGEGCKLLEDKEAGILSYWQPPEKNGTIGVGIKVDPALIAGFEQDKLNYLVLIKTTAGKPFTYYTGACWDRGLDFKDAQHWEKYLKDFKME